VRKDQTNVLRNDVAIFVKVVSEGKIKECRSLTNQMSA